MDAVQIDNEDEIDELMNDFDTEFIAPEEIKLTGNPSNVSALRLQPNANELETDKKRKKNPTRIVPPSHGNATFLHILENIVFLRAELPTNLTKAFRF